MPWDLFWLHLLLPPKCDGWQRMKDLTLIEFTQSHSPMIGYRGNCKVEKILHNSSLIEVMLLEPDTLTQQHLHTAATFLLAHCYQSARSCYQRLQTLPHLQA
jgi:hypothetical protein